MTFNDKLRASLDELNEEQRKMVTAMAKVLTRSFVAGRPLVQKHLAQMAPVTEVQAVACSMVALVLSSLDTAAIYGKAVAYTRDEWMNLAADAWDSTTVELDILTAAPTPEELN